MASSFNIPSIGTPHHAMEEDAMINPQAQAAQQNRQIGHGSATQTHSTSNLSQQNSFSYGGGVTPQSLLSTGQTPQHLLSNSATPATLSSQHSSVDKIAPKVEGQVGSVGATGSHLYAPCPSPAPPSPVPPGSMQATSVVAPPPLETAIVPQLQNIVSTVR